MKLNIEFRVEKFFKSYKKKISFLMTVQRLWKVYWHSVFFSRRSERVYSANDKERKVEEKSIKFAIKIQRSWRLEKRQLKRRKKCSKKENKHKDTKRTEHVKVKRRWLSLQAKRSAERRRIRRKNEEIKKYAFAQPTRQRRQKIKTQKRVETVLFCVV